MFLWQSILPLHDELSCTIEVLSSHEYLLLILSRYIEIFLQIVVPIEVTNTQIVGSHAKESCFVTSFNSLADSVLHVAAATRPVANLTSPFQTFNRSINAHPFGYHDHGAWRDAVSPSCRFCSIVVDAAPEKC